MGSDADWIGQRFAIESFYSSNAEGASGNLFYTNRWTVEPPLVLEVWVSSRVTSALYEQNERIYW